MIQYGAPGGLKDWAPAFGPGRDPGVPGSNPASGSPQGACFSLCLGLRLSVSLMNKYNLLKTKIKCSSRSAFTDLTTARGIIIAQRIVATVRRITTFLFQSGWKGEANMKHCS